LFNGYEIIMRNNFYDWKISINSNKEIIINPKGLFNPSEKISSIYCEGFKEEWVFDCYNNNQKNFTKGLSISYFYWTGSDGMTNSVKLSKEESIVAFINNGKDGLLNIIHARYEAIDNLLK